MENSKSSVAVALTTLALLASSFSACAANDPDTVLGSAGLSGSGTGGSDSSASSDTSDAGSCTAANGCLASAKPDSSLGSGTPTPTGSDAATTSASPDAGTVSTGLDAATIAPSSALTLITEPGQGLTPIYDLISSAKQTLDMTMYELTDTTVTGLLATAVKNGVTVRVILDQNLEKSSNTTAYDALNAANVSVHWANTTYAATHQKTITVDRTTSAIMTLNLTPEYYSTSRDFAVITTDAADVAAIESTFDDDFTNTSLTPATGGNLVWSPTNSQSSLLDVINGATTTLTTENEEMSDTAIVSALESAATRGVDVKVVMTASSSWDSDFAKLKTAGVKVVTYAATASLYIHAKVILADFGTSTAKLFVGSENYSSASLTENRELGLITTDAATMTSMSSTLASDYSGGTAYTSD